MARFRDIKPFTPWSDYAVTVPWKGIQRFLDSWHGDLPPDLDPPFQRAHVWTMPQRSRYIEFILRRGRTGRDILWNCQDHRDRGAMNQLVLVDGKQRLTSVQMFLDNQLPAFGLLRNQYEDDLAPMEPTFTMHVNDLRTDREVLQWYLDINDGGVVHTQDELDKVRQMLAALPEE